MRISGRLLALSGALAIAASARAASSQSHASLTDLDAYVAKAVRDWEVPGLAIAVVHNDSIVMAKGYGVRRIGRPEAVDVHTVFAVASTTKAMTSALMGMLVDSGLVAWDDRVVSHTPDFQLDDPYVTREMRIRDLLTHRGGLSITDYLWEDTASTYKDILHRLPYLEPTYSMRSRFVYQNVMYAAAGHLESVVAGMSWDELIRRRIFQPLGMTDSRTSTHDLDLAGDVAMPHGRVHDTLTALRWRNIDAIGPAGSVSSSVTDMARWMRFVLDSGRVGGRRLLSAAAIREMFSPYVVVPLDFYPAWQLVRPNVVTYGLGWFMYEYRGQRVAMHTGSIDGMSTIVGLLPDSRVGVVVLINQDHAEVRHALLMRTLDMFIGGPVRDWSAELRPFYDSIGRHARDSMQAAQMRLRVPGAVTTLPLAAYVGSYRDSLYGSFSIRQERGSLVGWRGPYAGDLEPWGYDAFRYTDRGWTHAQSLVTCVLTADGRVSELRFDDGRRYTRVPSS